MTGQRERLRLSAGLGRLEEWTADAGQAEKNALYRMLFAVAEGVVFSAYEVLDDVTRMGVYFVRVRPGLVVKICFPQPGTFEVLWIGSPADGPFTGAGAA